MTANRGTMPRMSSHVVNFGELWMRTCNIYYYAVFSTSLFFLFRDLSVLSLFIFLLHWLQLFPLSRSNLRVDPDSVSFLSRLFELAQKLRFKNGAKETSLFVMSFHLLFSYFFSSGDSTQVHCVDLGESFPTHIFLQNLALIQLGMSPVKFACSPRTDPPERCALRGQQCWLFSRV